MGPARSASPFAAALLVLGVTACFPVMQTPAVRPGLHLDAGALALTDQTRDSAPQGSDVVVWAAPSFGFGRHLEVGVPLGLYGEEGLRSFTDRHAFGTDPLQPFVEPYAKLGLLDAQRDHLATVFQVGLPFVSSVSLLYGHDFRSWSPYGGVKWMASGGPAGDDPLVTRYQQKGQVLFIVSAGAEWRTAPLPAIEVGLLVNHYQEGAVYGDFGQPTVPRTLADLYVAARVRLGKR